MSVGSGDKHARPVTVLLPIILFKTANPSHMERSITMQGLQAKFVYSPAFFA